MTRFIKPFFLGLILFGGFFLVATYAGSAKDFVMSFLPFSASDVQGASTQRAQELQEQFTSDIGKQVDTVGNHVLEVTVGDVLNGASRVQKIPEDIQSFTSYISDMLTDMLQSKR